MLATSNTRKAIFCTMIAILATSISPTASAGPDLHNLTDEQLIDQYHRTVYREELQRRMDSYSNADRTAVRAKLKDGATKRLFPSQFADDELFEVAIDQEDPIPGRKAMGELKKRYSEATTEELAALVGRFRAAYKVTPYPKLLPDTSNRAEYSASQSAFSALDNVAKTVLPEAEALALFQEIYLQSGQRGAVTDFLLRLQGEPFRGEHTKAMLEDLQRRYKATTPEALRASGEIEELQAVIAQQLRPFADNTFEALKAREWQKSRLDILAMGRVENPEAKSMLRSYYQTLSREWIATESRLDVLRALVIAWNRDQDMETRQLLYSELAEILNMDHSANLHYLEVTSEVVSDMGDPYFLPLLTKARATIDPEAVRRASQVPEDILKNDIAAVTIALDRAVTKLEMIRAGAE